MDEPSLDLKGFKDCVIIYPERYLNGLCAEKLEEECDVIIKKGIKKIIINFKNTELINSIGISILIGIIDKLNKVKGSLYFTNLTKAHKETIHMLGLTKFVPIHETEEMALSHVNADIHSNNSLGEKIC